MKKTALPPELSALVHHVELNKSGWWGKAIQRIILTASYRINKELTAAEMVSVLSSDFSIHLDLQRTEKQIRALEKTGDLISLSGKFKISENTRKNLKLELESGEALQNSVKSKFDACLAKHCPELAGKGAWDEFDRNFLIPFVQELGANTYRLVLGNNLYQEGGNKLDQFARNYDKELHPLIRKAVEEFLDPKDEEVRAYVLRTLNASFFVEASSLKEGTLRALEKATGASNPVFNVFIDTNLLISILGLDTAVEEVVVPLMNLIKQLSGRVTIKLYLLKTTCDEFNKVITAKSLVLKGLHLPGNLSAVALESNLDAIDLRFVEEYKKHGDLDATRYFEPYLKNLITVIRAKGLDLYNDTLDGYTTNQHVIDDIHEEEEYEKKKYKNKAKDYDRLEHDIILWHFAKDRRPVKLDSPLAARYWVATLDGRLLSFDARKKNKTGDRVPICLHPSTLIQMLQFWVPRTPQLEEAMLSTMRLPFLSQDFDISSEKITLSIIKTLGNYENIETLDKSTLSTILTDEALRTKISGKTSEADKRKLIKEALVGELSRVKADLKSVSDNQRSLESTVAQKENLLQERVRASDELRAKYEREADERTRLEQELDTKSQTLVTAESQNKSLANRVDALEKHLASKEAEDAKSKQRRFFVQMWVITPALAAFFLWLLFSLIMVRLNIPSFYTAVAIGLLPILLLVGLIKLIELKGRNNEVVAEVKWFRRFKYISRFVNACLVIVGLVWGVASSIYSDEIKNAINTTIKTVRGQGQ
ncbi:MAG TPA: hypothetical protein VM911_08520 [Pyrinomonadaceae bacterium]|jgi:hypothetical protein|nr:hypothetical protein [Pyrinomonadaceae bacterium]